MTYSRGHSGTASYSTPREFATICVERLLGELGEATALEVFSTVYATVEPWEALAHQELIEVIEEECAPARRRGKWRTFRAAGA